MYLKVEIKPATTRSRPENVQSLKKHYGGRLGFVQGNRANRVKLLPCRRKQMPCLGKFALWNALSFFFTAKCFKNRGEILVLKKNVEFLEFFGFTLRFRTFQARKIQKNFSPDWKKNFITNSRSLLAMKFFYQSGKFWKKNFCLKCPET